MPFISYRSRMKALRRAEKLLGLLAEQRELER